MFMICSNIDGDREAREFFRAGSFLWGSAGGAFAEEVAVAWVKRCPNPMPGASGIEIRPLYAMSDFVG